LAAESLKDILRRLGERMRWFAVLSSSLRFSIEPIGILGIFVSVLSLGCCFDIWSFAVKERGLTSSC